MSRKLSNYLDSLEDPDKYVQVDSVDEYFSLPRPERTKFFGFWYKLPMALPWDAIDENMNDVGWGEFYARIKKEYPIQYRVRAAVNRLNSDLFGTFGVFTELKYKISCFFFPRNQQIRKAIPNQWMDLAELIEIVNFEIIKSFKNEADNSYVDYQNDDYHKEFYNWLHEANHYVTLTRSELQKELSESYPDTIQMKLPYELAYKRVNEIEKLIEDSDTKYLTELIKWRKMFWT